MLREYTASFTSVEPCLYQPPPGTAIVVAARPAGVKVHVPLRSTEATAAFPAATPSTPAAATAPRGVMIAAVAGVAESTDTAMSTTTAYRDTNVDRRLVRWSARLGSEATAASFRRDCSAETARSASRLETGPKP